MCAAMLLSVVGACDVRRSIPTQPAAVAALSPAPDKHPTPPAGEETNDNAASPREWTRDQWRDYFFTLVAEKGGGSITYEALAAMRPELNARGADWQNGWRGDYRPRVFLPVPDCPAPMNSDAPDCAWERAVDVGDWGGAWIWVPRF